MQTTKTALIIELALGVALGLGCSHAKTKADNLARRPQMSPSPRESTSASKPPAEDGTGNQGANEHAIYFALDSAQIADHDRPALQAVARAAQGSRIRIEGNCDERGTTEYNLALGDRRASAAAVYLERLGVAATRIDYVSYGSERPKDPGHDDAAWAKNRRDDIFVR